MAEQHNSAFTTKSFFVDDGNYVYFALLSPGDSPTKARMTAMMMCCTV